MTFPANEQVFIDRWLSSLDEPDETDKEFVTIMVQTINRAYYAGLAEGRKETAACRE